MNVPDALQQLAVAVQLRKDSDYRPYHLFLTSCLPEHNTQQGYRALARLMHEGFFSTILTSSTNGALEIALKEEGLSRYNILVVGHTPDEQIAAAIEGLESGIHIVKLPHHEAQINEASFLSQLPSKIQVGLKYYFNQSIIIVGCVDHDEESIFALRSATDKLIKEKFIYYIAQNALSPEDMVVKYLHQQGTQLEDCLITGNYGEFNTFFSSLEKTIKDRVGRKQGPPTKPDEEPKGTKIDDTNDPKVANTPLTRIQALFLAANPANTSQFAIEEEMRAIDQKVRASSQREALVFHSAWALRSDDLLQLFNQHQPHIVHFSGHGSHAGLSLRGSDGEVRLVTARALAALFVTLKGNIRLVFLNACYSREQAEALVTSIDCVIGMKENIYDNAATLFASSFYRAIGFGHSIRAAFDQGVASLLLEGIPEDVMPELLVKDGVDANKIVLIVPGHS